jgi:hypothetical protein
MTHTEINQAILDRELFTGDEESTYYNLYNYAVDNYEDPHLLFKISVYGYYAKVYKWTTLEADQFIEEHKDNSIKWTDGIQEYYYDWGKGKNKITEDYLHVPNLDHIDPHSLSKNNKPINFRIRCRRLNENKGNTNSDKERRATIIDLFNDMDTTNQEDLVKYLLSIKKY